jgi:hypothetical protein
MSVDPFFNLADSSFGPSRRAIAVSPHDTNELTILPKALYIGGGGAVVLRSVESASDVTFRNVASGQVLDVRAQFVRATGTTATDIVALA